MPRNVVVRLRACGVAAALILAIAHAAEKAPSLIGATRDQVIARLGAPKSQIAAGNREVIFFARERVVLRNGVVVEVETLPEDSTPRRAPPAAAAPESPPTKDGTPERGSAPAANPAAGTTTASPSATATPGASAGSEPAATAGRTTTAPATPPPPPEPKLEIKSVRPPSWTAPGAAREQGAASATPAKSATTTVTTAAPVSPSPDITTTPAPRTSAAAQAPAPSSSSVTIEPQAGVSTTAAAPVTSRATESDAAVTPAPAPVALASGSAEALTADDAKAEPATKTAEPAKAAPTAAEKKAKAAVAARRHLQDVEPPDPAAALFTTRTYVISLLIIGSGLGYLYWRYRQRQLELAATTVSRTPFSPPPTSAGGGALFNSELLSQLDWKRFEELVALYYSKTGVVAVRTKAGPTSPVNIKISWKGESRPFACVRCIAHPTGLVDAKPLQELFAVLTAEDIRRGYAVTTGKFSVPARDFAEEKHITLLPGDIFLEKLNALPDAARTEIMQEITSGDYTTPACPKCEGKMIRSADNPSMWQCAIHTDQQLPVRR